MNRLAEAAAAAHVFVADVDAAQPDVGPDDTHHLLRVLRVRKGERVTIGDGAGRWRLCTATGDGSSPVDAAGPVQVEPRHDPPITIGFALVKGERPEWIVQKLTEIGVDRIVAVRARRCVVRWTPEQESKNLVRLRRIAREASMQARRAWLPEVAPVADLADLAAATPGGVVLADPAGVPPSLSRPTLVVGPEGGWDPEELDGVATTRLGPQILRSETAALVAGVVLCTLRAGLLEPAADPGS